MASKDRKKRRRAKRSRGGDPSKRPEVLFNASIRHSALWVLAAMALYGLAHFLSHGEGGDVAGDLFAMGLIGTVLAVMMTSTSHSMKRRGGTCAVLALVAGLVIHYGSCPRAGCAWAPGATPAGPAGPRR